MPPYLIPYVWLPHFALTEDQFDHRSRDAFPQPSILTLLEQAGRTYSYDSFTALGFPSTYRSDKARLDAVLHDVDAAPKDLYLVYISTPDACGHRYGPDGSQLHEALHRLDSELAEFVDRFESAIPGSAYVFLGDHGMLQVERHLDAESEIAGLLAKAGLRRARDVIYFLDSTMVRLWAMSDKARRLLPEILSTSSELSQHGAWMDQTTAQSFRIPWPDRRYGDHLWCANPGVLVFPDFFRRLAPCKGMHGYDPRLPESQGTCVVWSKERQAHRQSWLPLTGVFDLLKGSLEL